ncbi:MAG: hypothetical protein ACOCRO_06460 [Halanaerobiales bacterium]
MIKKQTDYEKIDFDVQKVHSALSRIPENISYIGVTKQLDKNEFEEIKLSRLDELLELNSPNKIKSFIVIIDQNGSVFLNNNFSKYTVVSIRAEKRENIIKIKDILEQELELKEMKNYNLL